MSIIMKPTSVIKARLGIDPNGRVHKFFTSECAKAMDKYVPMKNGILIQYKIIDNYIVYGDNGSNAYAKYQYKGMREDGTHVINPENRTRTFHPLATSYWDKKMVTAEMPDIVKRIQKKFGGK